MGTRGELVWGFADLDATASGRYSVAAGQAGTVSASAPCPVWVLTNHSDTGTIYWAPGRGYTSAAPAVNPAAQQIGPGESRVIHSPQRNVILWNPAGNPAVEVEVQAWR